MVVDRSTGTISHRQFSDLEHTIPAGDAIVLNTTACSAPVLGVRDNGTPARFCFCAHWARTCGGDGASGRQAQPWPDRKIAEDFEARSCRPERRTRVVQLYSKLGIETAIDRYGHIPLPPYITRADEPSDAERYQTVYAKESGSVAAPTAGLHFTPEMLERLAAKGVKRADVILHVGAGTFAGRHGISRRPRDARGVVHTAREDRADPERDRSRGGKIWAVAPRVRTLRAQLATTVGFERAADTGYSFIRYTSFAPWIA